MALAFDGPTDPDPESHGPCLVRVQREERNTINHTGEYLYILRLTRPELLEDEPTEAEAASLERHEAYLRRLTDEGVVILAGRTQEEDESTFGIVIFRADSPEAARELMRRDPAVADGVMRAELHPYRVAFRGP